MGKRDWIRTFGAPADARHTLAPHQPAHRKRQPLASFLHAKAPRCSVIFNHVNAMRPAPKLMSFDVYGTLINVRDGSYSAFERILAATDARNVDVREFWEYWESRNIAQYLEPYKSYRQICETSLSDSFIKFGLTGSPELVNHYFDAFSSFLPYEDVEPTLDRLAGRYRLAIVSNIDDDLFAATPLGRSFDLVCTAQRARGYKPDGTLFQYLINNAGVAKDAIFHSGQSQFTDLVGGKPLGLTIAWINRRGIALHDSVPRPDFVFPDIKSLLDLVET